MVTVHSLEEFDLEAYGVQNTSVCIHSLLAVCGKKLHLLGLLKTKDLLDPVLTLRLHSFARCEILEYADTTDLESKIMDLTVKKPIVDSFSDDIQQFRLVHPEGFKQTTLGIEVLVVRTKYLVIGITNDEKIRQAVLQILEAAKSIPHPSD